MNDKYRDHVLTAREMKLLEEEYMEKYGVKSITLMEQAAKAVRNVINKQYPNADTFYICCGIGVNAGDGFALARLLHNDGHNVKVFALSDLENYKDDTRQNLNELKKLDVETIHIRNANQIDYYERPDVYIDALFGIGLNREVTDIYYSAVSYLNSSGVPVVSIDVPSGLDATTGSIQGISIKADCTVTFAYAKRGHFLKRGREYTGKLFVEKIWNEDIPLLNSMDTYMLNENAIRVLLDKRRYDMHKATFGRIGVIAGTLGMVGAAIHSAKAAYECGCGLVTLFADRDVAMISQILAPNIMVRVNESGSETFNEDVENELNKFMSDKDVIVIGPGLSGSDFAKKICVYIQQTFNKPLVMDADALKAFALAGSFDATNCILTPHPGEAARLLACETDKILNEPVESARNIAESTKAVTVLKGHTSIVMNSQGRMYINIKGNPALAKGGSGDVLTGIIAAFAARGIANEKAAALGCYVLGAAADKYIETKSENTLSPEKIIKQLEFILP